MSGRLRRWAGLAALSCGIAAAAPPFYSAATILNASNLSPGPYAPNSVVSIYGSNLAWSAQGLSANDVAGGALPTTLNGVQVFVDGSPAPLFYVSESQVNFLMPVNQVAGQVTLWLVRESIAGPQVAVTLQETAPALFPSPASPGYAIAQRWPDYSLVAPDSAASPGAIVILYAAGLGKTQPYPRFNEIPLLPAPLERAGDFRVYLDGKPVDPSRLLYAGLAPGWPGLYQINLILAEDVGSDPEIRIALGDQASPPGLKLAIR